MIQYYRLFLLFLLCSSGTLNAQNIYQNKQFQFLSFEKIPTWVGVVSNWQSSVPKVHLYDPIAYKGHAQFVSVGLKTGINFQQFKAQVQQASTRQYMPFFLFDLRDSPITISGIDYKWAVRIEDYRYKDPTSQMADESLKLMNILSNYIHQQSGQRSNGIIILATNPAATPNSSIASTLNANNYPNLTRNALLNKVGGKRVEILNEGIGIGYLKYVPAGQEKKFKATTKDILIYENLPERVPPVSGIITLTPQTPLSHINLLAKNRGTINLYATALKFLPNASSHLNKLVKIDCSKKSISISPISLYEAEKFWKVRTKKVAIPQANTSLYKMISLSQFSPNQTVQHIGAKASNYAKIRQLFPKYVRKAHAIPFYHYFKTIQDCGAKQLIEELAQQKPTEAALQLKLKAIREKIKTAQVSNQLLDEIITLIQKDYHNAKIRLRSSTNCEDLAEFNGAGLYESKGFKIAQGRQKLKEKILKVYASLWNDIAYQEREFYLIDHRKAGMAILINQAFPDEYANGVAITIFENKKLSSYINTQYGENSVTNPKNGEIPETIHFKSAYQQNYAFTTHSNIHPIFKQKALQSQLMELRKTLLAIHLTLTKNQRQLTNQTYGVDIEFKLMDENGVKKLYIKQARLLRVLSPN